LAGVIEENERTMGYIEYAARTAYDADLRRQGERGRFAAAAHAKGNGRRQGESVRWGHRPASLGVLRPSRAS
jgi:hypothetical protein